MPIGVKLYIYIYIGLVGRVFANGPGDLGSISGRVILKTFKMVLDTSLLKTQHYKVHIKGKVELSRERSSALPKLLKREPSVHPRLQSPTLLYLYIYCLSNKKLTHEKMLLLLPLCTFAITALYVSLSLPPTRQELTQGQ